MSRLEKYSRQRVDTSSSLYCVLLCYIMSPCPMGTSHILPKWLMTTNPDYVYSSFDFRLVMTELATTEKDYVDKLGYCIEVRTYVCMGIIISHHLPVLEGFHECRA